MSHTTSLPPLSAGRQLAGKFEIVGVLGEGGMGIVYEARRLVEGDNIALKVIHNHLAGDAQIRGRFTREAAILRRLEGKRLCPLLEFGEIPDPRREEAGLLYMALPRIEGPALDALLKREGMLPVGRAVEVVLDVCEALREAHSQGVIHRDLKPGNVLLCDGDGAMVVDFGMAKIVTGGGTGTTALTQHNMVFGTPEYMAPEQARGDELDARCDVYATGVILYELLTGTVPFGGGTALSVLTAHMTAAPESLRERAPDRDIPPALEAVVLHALAKDPGQRYATAGALATAIQRALEAPRDVAGVMPASRVNVPVDTTDALGPTFPARGREATRASPRPRTPRPASVNSLPRATRVSSGWVFVCVVAGLVGVTIGAWLSMRGH